jgi:hypothetical protein
MKFLLLLVTLCLNYSVAEAETFKLRNPVEKVSSTLSSTERQVRAAAVKVITPAGGHGSGSLIKYKDLTLVFTARHVTDDPIGTTYLITKNSNQAVATLMYQSDSADIAVLLLNSEFRDSSIKPMDWKLTSDYDIGKGIVYSGYPSNHKLMSFNGRIAGYGPDRHGTQLIVNTYGWFGCSGSVIYDEKGKIIGILYGVDIEYYPGIQINENMIWVAPIKHVNIEDAIKPLCRGTLKKYRACQ